MYSNKLPDDTVMSVMIHQALRNVHRMILTSL